MTEIITPSTDIVVTEREQFAPGWYKDISNERYHGSAGTSSSQLKTLMEHTPAHLAYGLMHPTEPTANMALGTAVHSLVLEPDKFNDDIAVMPNINKRTNAGKQELAIFEAENKGKTIISEDQLETAKKMAARVWEHESLKLLFDDIVVESSVYGWYRSMDPDDGEEYRQMLKVRPDAIPRAYPILIDLKTTNDGTYSGFQKSIQNFYYHLSAAMYLQMCNDCKPLLDETGFHAFTKFVFVCIENKPPYEVSSYEMSPEYMEIGKKLFRMAVYRLHRAKAEGFPGFEQLRLIDPPGYANRGFIV